MHQIRTNVNPSVDLQIMEEPGKQITREMKLNRVARTRTETKPTTKTTTPTLLLTLAVVAVAAAFPVAAQDRGDRRGQTRVYTLDPSTHGFPEGIAYDKSTGAFFVGATGDGTIYRGTLDKPTITEFITGAPGKEATGMKVCPREVVRGGWFLGRGLCLRASRPGSLWPRSRTSAAACLTISWLRRMAMSSSPTRSFPRCGTSRRRRSRRAVALRTAFRSIPRSDTRFTRTRFNLNGIVALKGGRSFIVVQSNTGKLFRIDLDRQCALWPRDSPIAVEPLVDGDGLLLDGGDLLVVQNGPPAMLTFVRLNGRGGSGHCRSSADTDPSLRESVNSGTGPQFLSHRQRRLHATPRHSL